eukprot:gb/GECG01006153.1/.p1 GENE.gb/GECG01006153.1/~~gb/GECG01006153.1/.p1  ORF type:complete len:322 (+),score=41.13 gb/GECG01006153.1/:1-966(+)
MAAAPTNHDHTSSSKDAESHKQEGYSAQHATHGQPNTDGHGNTTFDETPNPPKPVSTIALLLSLTANDYSWRSKVLKVVQYLIKLHVWRLKFKSKSDHTERWSGAAKNLSISRALFTVGSSIDTVDRFLKGVSSLSGKKDDILTDSKTALQLTTDGIDAVSEVIDDINALKKSQVLEQRNLPSWFPRAVELTWALTCVIRLTEALEKMKKTKKKLQEAKEEYHHRLSRKDHAAGHARVVEAEDPHKLGDYSQSITYASHKLHVRQQAYVSACLNTLKCLLDCGQSLPPALYFSELVPDSADIGCGLFSGIIGIVRTILDSH